jgi:ubiquinone/menaquinone biosynthesis C-methylase UbiE
VNYIKQILGKDVVGFTCNPQELRFARRHYPRIRIKFGDMHSLSFRNEEFDAVYCREAYEHSVAPYIAMCEMNRVLRYHGYLLINIPDEQWLAYDSHFSVLTQAQMSEMFRKCRFELLQKGRSPAGHYWYLARKTGQAPGLWNAGALRSMVLIHFISEHPSRWKTMPGATVCWVRRDRDEVQVLVQARQW